MKDMVLCKIHKKNRTNIGDLKLIIYFLCTICIIFNTFYYDYKKSEAMELGMTIAIEEALLYLAGLCGITLTGAAIADLSPAQRRQIKDAFDEGCQQSSISQQEQIAWEQKLCEGVLDKTSACWKAFLDSISTSRDIVDNTFSHNGMAVDIESVISSISISTQSGKDTNVIHPQMEEFEYLNSTQADIVAYNYTKNSSGYYVVRIYYGDISPEATKLRIYSTGFIQEYISSWCEMNYRIVENTYLWDGTLRKSDILSGKINVKNFVNKENAKLFCYQTIDTSLYTNDIGDIAPTEKVPSFSAYNHWSDIGVFNGDRTLSDVFNLINRNAVADNGVVNIPWEDVCDYPIPMPGDTANDRVGHLSPEIERLWEKLAAGEITWEKFIDLLQDAVGVVTLEGVIADDIPIEGDQPIVIEQELVPENPDKPKDKEEIIEENISNTAYTFDIKEFFPFCIPFDLYNIISYLNAEPEAPKFDIPIPSYDRSGNLTMANKITVDLSMFDSVALVFRVCIFIIFIIGLIIITRNLIRG